MQRFLPRTGDYGLKRKRRWKRLKWTGGNYSELWISKDNSNTHKTSLSPGCGWAGSFCVCAHGRDTPAKRDYFTIYIVVWFQDSSVHSLLEYVTIHSSTDDSSAP